VRFRYHLFSAVRYDAVAIDRTWLPIFSTIWSGRVLVDSVVSLAAIIHTMFCLLMSNYDGSVVGWWTWSLRFHPLSPLAFWLCRWSSAVYWKRKTGKCRTILQMVANEERHYRTTSWSKILFAFVAFKSRHAWLYCSDVQLQCRLCPNWSDAKIEIYINIT